MPETCTRGCTTFRRHLPTCWAQDGLDGAFVAAQLGEPDRDRLCDGDSALTAPGSRSKVWLTRYGGLEVWQVCAGCLPREATHGHLCVRCHDRLLDWLDRMPGLAEWLRANLVPVGGSGARQDWQRPGSSEGLPAPVRISVMDLQTLLSDRLMELEDCARDVFDRPARTGRFELRDAVSFLRAWLTKIEDDLDLVNHVYDLLEDLVRQARQVVPWEDRPRRIAGILCPYCDRAELEVKPGMEDVTCRRCRGVITRRRYDIWTKMLADEAGQRRGVS